MFECYELQIMRQEYSRMKTVAERKKQLKIISGHRKTCRLCNGEYQTAGLQQLKDQAFAGSWGNNKI